jgi:hypothetical protein
VTVLTTGGPSSVKLQRDPGAAVTAATGSLGQLNFYGASDGAHTLRLAAAVFGSPEGTFSGTTNNPGAISIYTAATVSVVERVRFDSVGATHFGPGLTSGLTTSSNLAFGADGSIWVNPQTYSGNQPATAKATITAAGAILANANGGIGYGTGSGGTVAQATNKSTGVTLSKINGQITMQATALAATTNVSFTLTNLAIGADDVVYVQHKSAGTAGAYSCWSSNIAAGSCTITVRNTTAGSLSEAILLTFVVIKSATS